MTATLLITSAQVADYLKIADTPALEPHILYAQSVAAAEIGTESLIERAVTQTEWFDGPLVLLRDGPLASLTSLTIGGTAADLTQLIARKWTIAAYPSYRYSYFYGLTAVGYKAGYTAATLPDRIAEFLIAIAGTRFKNPDSDMVSEKIGDYSYSRKGNPQQGGQDLAIPKELALLLAGYKRPGVA